MKNLRIWLYRIGLAAGLIFLLIQVYQGAQAFINGTNRIGFPLLVIVSIGTGIAAVVLQMTGWAILMRTLGVNLPWREVLLGYSLSFLPRYIPGSIWGYLGRNEWLYQEHKIKYSVTNFGSILEVLCILAANGIMIGSFYYASFQFWSKVFVIGLSFAVIFGLWLVIVNLQKWGARFSILKRFLSEPIQIMLPLSKWVVCIAIYIGMWLLNGLVFQIASICLLPNGIQFPIGNTIQFISGYSAAWLAGFFAVFVPAGIGIREIVLSNIVLQILPITTGQASAISVLTRLFITLSEFAWVIIGFLLKRKQVVLGENDF